MDSGVLIGYISIEKKSHLPHCNIVPSSNARLTCNSAVIVEIPVSATSGEH